MRAGWDLGCPVMVIDTRNAPKRVIATTIQFETLNRGLNNQVLYKLFLDKWDGTTKVVPGVNGVTPPVIVGN